MKTLHEVIRAYELCLDKYIKCNECPYHERGCPDAKKVDALQHLKEYRGLLKMWNDKLDKEQENQPLEWEELHTMKGKPIWVEYNFQISNKEFRDNSKRWCIIREFKPWHDTEIIITENGFVLSKNEQVKDWQAYRKERS